MGRKSNKDKIIEELNSLGLENPTLQSKDIAELKEILDGAKKATSTLDSLVPEDSDFSVTVEDGPESIPNRCDPEWTDYVLGLLDQEKEMEGGNPRTDGLRRIAERLYGNLVTRTNIVDTPKSDNAFRATVVVTVSFANGVIADGAVDVYSGNTDRLFAIHAVATAETRAEGRALRKALRLTKVLAAEELHNASKDEPNGQDSRIPVEMISSLKIMADRTRIDILKLANSQGMSVQSLEDLTQKQGIELANIISKYNRKEIVLNNDVLTGI